MLTPREGLRHLVLLTLLGSASAVSYANAFLFSVTAPDFTVSLPTIPSMAMSENPLRSKLPHLRYSGSQGPYNVSVSTPTADAGMTASECASSTVGQLSARPGVPALGSIYRVRINERTYAAIYASPSPGMLMLHAHFVSAAATGSHCIEVHASKVATSKDDVDAWFKGFGSANIEVR